MFLKGLVVTALALSMNLNLSAQGTFGEHGYPISNSNYTGLYFLGFGYCFAGRPNRAGINDRFLSLYLKGTVSGLLMEGIYFTVNPLLSLQGHLRIMSSNNGKAGLYLQSSFGVCTMLNGKISNDNGTIWSIGISYQRKQRAIQWMINYEGQNHQANIEGAPDSRYKLGVIKIGFVVPIGLVCPGCHFLVKGEKIDS